MGVGATPVVDLSDERAATTLAVTNAPGHRRTSDDRVARVMMGDDVIAAIDRGVVVLALTSDDAPVRGWSFGPDEVLGAPLAPAAHVFRAELPCEVLRTGQPTDVSRVLADGRWYATVDGRGTAQITLEGTGDKQVWRHDVTNGRGKAANRSQRTSIDTRCDSRHARGL